MEKITYHREWRCGVFESGFSNGDKCNPRDPHDPSWGCQWVLRAPLLKDNQAARDRLAANGILVED